MGIFDVHAKTWQAPTRQELAHKTELHSLEEAEERKRRQMKNELETLRKVEDLQHESAEEARQLLNANARDAARRRAVSGLSDREALLLAQREHNTARLRSLAAHPQANVSPNISMHLPASPSLATYGAVPTIHVPSSSNMLGAGLQLGATSTPRVRSLSTHHTPHIALAPFPGSSQPHLGVASPHVPLIGVHSSPSLGPMSRPRAVSSVGIGGSATSERIRLEERKRALLQKEADLQEARERRLLAKKSMLDLDAHELALKKKVQELDARAKLESHERFLDDQEARLQQRQRDQLMEAELVDRLNSLSVNTPSLNPLHTSPRLGHARHASSPIALAVDAGRSPHLAFSPRGASPMLSTNTIGSNLLSPDGYSSAGHVRSRSIGQSPLLGTHALDANMAADAARLGILPAGLGSHGLPDHSLGLGHDEISAAYARAGVSPRFGPVDYGYDLGGLNGGGNYRNEYDLGLDGLGGVSPRSRRGSLSGGVDGLGLSNGNFGEGFGSGGLLDNRGRRDSLPFQY